MIEVHTKLRRWGNSLGIVVPTSAVAKEHIEAGEEVSVLLMRKHNILRETFGTFRFKKPVRQMMDEIDRELYND